MTLREPPKERRAANIVGRFVGLLVLLAVFAVVIWATATNQQAAAIQRSDPSIHAPGRHVAVPGAVLHVRTVGEGTDTLLVHYDTVAGGVPLIGIAEELASTGRRVTVPDLEGFGFSSRPDEPGRRLSTTGHAETLASLLEESGLVDLEVVGFGWGGEVATELAVIRPDLVGRLILVDTSALPVPDGEWHSFEGMPLGLGEAAAYTFSGASPRAESRFVAECPSWADCQGAETLEAYRLAASVPGTARGIWARRATDPALVALSRLDEVDAAVTVIAVDISTSDAEALAQQFPEAEAAPVQPGGLVEAVTG
ncbi:MAG TPA: alpha/beta fold hydrolase [Acidimicrobiia bacterium]|nr:alpha/beta fold hydrolase [Acidimicrobiia bacterium]